MAARFQPPTRALSSRDYQFIVGAALLLALIATSLVFLNLRLHTGGGEFYVTWVASRAFFFDHIEPYSGDVAARAQQLAYGRTAKPGEQPYILDTPFYLLSPYFPFALLSDAALARAIFTAALEIALAAFAYLSLRLMEWEAPRLLSLIVIAFGIFNFYSIQALYAGSPVLFLGLLYAGILLSLRAEADELTGALIALSFYYWEVGAPFLFLVVLRAYGQGRSGVLAGFLMVTIILLAVSFLLYPGWIIPFGRAAFNNLRTDFGFNVFTIFTKLWPSSGKAIAWMITLGLLLLLGIEWSAASGHDFRRFFWAACLTLAATPLLGFRSELGHLAVLVLPLTFIFAVAHDRWRGVAGRLGLPLLQMVLFGFPWLLYYYPTGVSERSAGELLFVFFPMATIGGLYWIRWWALSPPRTWRDLAERG